MCFLIDLRNKQLTFYINDIVHKGNISIVGPSSSIFVQGGGVLILGQEQDESMGGYSVTQSFEGLLVNYVLDNTIFDNAIIQSFLNCQINPSQNTLASFSDLDNDWTLHGSVESLEMTMKDICEEDTKYSVFFPEPRPHKNAFSLCKMLKGKVIVPENEMENSKIVNMSIAANLTSTCTNGFGIYMWLGVEAANRSDAWQMIDAQTKQPLTYMNFRPGYSQIHADFNCAYFDSYEIGSWTIYPCEHEACVACSFEQLTPLRLKGLCRNSLVDRKYFLVGYHDRKPKLEGLSHSQITFRNGTWVITDTIYPHILGIMQSTDLNPYPFGLREWTIKGDVCPESTLNLLLTSCQSHQYTCNDGTCIPKMQRCDLQVQCPDQSDETLCTVVVVPSDYIKQVRP